MPRNHLIFDLDGTLIDTVPDLLFLLNGFLKTLGRPQLQPGDMKYLIGQGSHYLIEQMCARTGGASGADEIEALYSRWIEIYANAPMDLTVPFKGVPETLQKLKDAGCKLAICTNKPPAPAAFILNKLDLKKYFDVVLDADSLPFRKPRPEPLWEAIRQTGGTLENAVMIGDSEPDAAAAAAAGIPVVLMSYGYAQNPYHSIKSAAVLSSFADLYDTVSALS